MKRHGGILNAYLLSEKSQSAKATDMIPTLQCSGKDKWWRQQKDRWLPGAGQGGKNRWNTEECRAVKTRCDTVIVDTWQYTTAQCTKCTTLRVDPSVHYGLQVIMMQIQQLWQMYDSGGARGQQGGYAWVATGDTWEIPVLSAQFCCEP